MSAQKRKRNAYGASFKLKVVQFAQDCGSNRKAAAEFGIDEKQVRQWKKMSNELQQMPRTKKARRGYKPAFPREEQELQSWVLDLRQNGYIVTRGAIRMKAKELIQHPDFKASAGWCTRFMRRHQLTIRQKTKICQKLPADLDDKITTFQRYVISLRKDYNYPLSHIGNMDETPMFFDLPSNRTVDSVGAQTVTVRTTGHEKTHFTTVLACMADGTKLPHMVIFKRKTMPKENFPPGVVVHVHPKGWMDEEGMLLWLKKVWGRRPGGGLTNERSLLVWDQFRAHLMDRVKKRTKNGYNTDIAVIPGGLTSILQPLDVCFNYPVKCRVREQWMQWMSSGGPERTPAGNFKRPSLSLVTTWVKTAWDALNPQMVAKSFKKCAISNALDGTEDDVLWQDTTSDNGSDNDSDTGEQDDVYEDIMTSHQAAQLLTESESEDEFEGFE